MKACSAVEWRGHGEPRARRRSGDDGGCGEAKCRSICGRWVVLVARGGGGDGVVAMAKTNQLVELRQWRVAMVKLLWCSTSSARRCGEAERGGSERASGWSGRCVAFMHACWSDQLGRHRCTAAMRWPRPVVGRPLPGTRARFRRCLRRLTT